MSETEKPWGRIADKIISYIALKRESGEGTAGTKDGVIEILRRGTDVRNPVDLAVEVWCSIAYLKVEVERWRDFELMASEYSQNPTDIKKSDIALLRGILEGIANRLEFCMEPKEVKL